MSSKNDIPMQDSEDPDLGAFGPHLQMIPLAQEDPLVTRGIIIIDNIISNQSLADASKQLLSFHFDETFIDPIQIILNSPGGYNNAGHSFIDLMGFIKNPIRTIALGQIASMATLIFIHGDERIIGPNCTSMIHQFSYCSEGNYSDLVASRKHEDMEASRHIQMYMNCSKYNTIDQVQKHLIKSYDNFLSPEEMLEHGLCDQIFTSHKKRHVNKQQKISKHSKRPAAKKSKMPKM